MYFLMETAAKSIKTVHKIPPDVLGIAQKNYSCCAETNF